MGQIVVALLAAFAGSAIAAEVFCRTANVRYRLIILIAPVAGLGTSTFLLANYFQTNNIWNVVAVAGIVTCLGFFPRLVLVELWRLAQELIRHGFGAIRAILTSRWFLFPALGTVGLVWLLWYIQGNQQRIDQAAFLIVISVVFFALLKRSKKKK